MPDSVALPLAIAVSGAVFLPLLIGMVLVIRDTVRRKGKWGVNTRLVECPFCGEPAPAVRTPKNRRQRLWGGHTCDECGGEYDKWGEPVGEEADRDR